MTDTRSLDRQGVRLIGASLMVLGLVAGLVLWRQVHTPSVDPVTLRAPEPLRGEVAILLDTTDPLTADQLSDVTEWLREFELSQLLPNERLTVWVLGTRRSGGLARVFARCYPGRETDQLLHNPAVSATRCESLFTRPLRQAVKLAASGPHFSRSPILEAIREISNQPEFADPGVRRHLIVISDLEQNTPVLNFYRAVPSFSTFQRSARFTLARASLSGVAVDVLYLPREVHETLLDSKLVDFWRAYFSACGARPVRMRRV